MFLGVTIHCFVLMFAAAASGRLGIFMIECAAVILMFTWMVAIRINPTAMLGVRRAVKWHYSVCEDCRKRNKLGEFSGDQGQEGSDA